MMDASAHLPSMRENYQVRYRRRGRILCGDHGGKLYIVSISASPTACRLRGHGRGGTQNDRLAGAVIVSTQNDRTRRGGHFEYRHVHTRAIDMPSAMLRIAAAGDCLNTTPHAPRKPSAALSPSHMCIDMRTIMRWLCYAPLESSRRGGRFEYRRTYTRATDVPSAMADVGRAGHLPLAAALVPQLGEPLVNALDAADALDDRTARERRLGPLDAAQPRASRPARACAVRWAWGAGVRTDTRWAQAAHRRKGSRAEAVVLSTGTPIPAQ